MSYLDELSRELGSVGIRGARRRRILAEAEDHLSESGDVAAFGSPRVVAQRFADELATSGARRGAYVAFAALAPLGIAYAGLFLTIGGRADITSARTVPIGIAGAALMLLAPQVALAAGMLAVLRAWRLRALDAAPAAELRVLRRRAALAIASGGLTFGAVALFAYEYSAGLPNSWVVAAAACSAGAVLPLGIAVRAVARTGGIRSAVAGDAGDLTTDVEPLLRFLPPSVATPWRLCGLFAAAVALAALIGAGFDEGPRNAIAELVAVCAAFGLLGRWLGLRR